MKTRMFSKYIMTHHNKSAWRESGTQSRQGHSQNLKAVPQNFMEVFKVDDVTANDAIQKKQHLLRKEKLQISHNHYCLISIFSIKLLRKIRNLVFISKEITSQFQYFLDWNLYDDFTIWSANLSNCCRYTCILASLYYFWQNVHNALLANIYLFKVWIVTLE